MFQTFAILKENQVNMVKNVKKNLLEIHNFPHKLNNQRFWTAFYVFHHVNLNLFKNNKSFEHLKILFRIFFVLGVFQKFDVDIWPLLKAEKVLTPKQFWQEKKFLQNFIFFHPYESINLQPAGLLKIALIVTPLI